MLDVDRLHLLCDEGRYATVRRELEAAGASFRPEEPELAWVAARVLHHLGAVDRSTRLELATYRRAPRNPVARYLRAQVVARDRSPLDTLAALEDVPDGASPRLLVRWLAFRASISAALADHDAAALDLEKARSLAPDDAVIATTAVDLAFADDRHEDAVALARAAREAHPRNPYVAHTLASTLASLGRRGEAIDVLAAIVPETEAAFPLALLAVLLHEAERYEEAERALDVDRARSPLRQPEADAWTHAVASSCAYGRGDLQRAAVLAEQAGGPWHVTLAQRLRDDARGTARVRLDVPLVRQHTATCFPAALTMVARHFGTPVDHVEVAERICFDGTPTWSARSWAEEHGFVVRQATVTWDTAVALADRGIPFVLVTLGATAGHAMVVTGYDQRLGTLHLRDPSAPALVEVDTDRLLARRRDHVPAGARAGGAAALARAVRVDGPAGDGARARARGGAARGRPPSRRCRVRPLASAPARARPS